ncbi:MAG: serine protease [Gammaproteobacteria bacterium]|nr:trypsin-like peptidase domain-containing protein [Pseudomonadales bacterium]
MIQITENFQPLDEFGHFTQQAIMPIIAAKQGRYWPVGTGFMISPDGLMMTAAHVIQEAYFRVMGKQPEDGKHHEIEMELYALYITNEKHGPNNEHNVGGFISISNVSYPRESDIAFCRLRGIVKGDGERLKFPVVKLSPGIPQIGQKVLGFGYYKMKCDEVGQSEGKTKLEYGQNTAFTKGEIVEIHPQRRDTALLNFPVFRTSARFDGGDEWRSCF